LRVGSWGVARLRVAQFLANLWQGPGWSMARTPAPSSRQQLARPWSGSPTSRVRRPRPGSPPSPTRTTTTSARQPDPKLMDERTARVGVLLHEVGAAGAARRQGRPERVDPAAGGATTPSSCCAISARLNRWPDAGSSGAAAAEDREPGVASLGDGPATRPAAWPRRSVGPARRRAAGYGRPAGAGQYRRPQQCRRRRAGAARPCRARPGAPP
jgi:hypothetical protein